MIKKDAAAVIGVIPASPVIASANASASDRFQNPHIKLPDSPPRAQPEVH